MKKFSSPYIIPPHQPFELVRLPDGQIKKLAHGRLFDRWREDFEIELAFIQKYEFAASHRGVVLDEYSAEELGEAKEKLKFHYRRAVACLSPEMAGGWNRWSEYILDLFLANKLYRVLWGSGGCGKSRMYGLLVYIKWRVNPFNRMWVVASMVLKESQARVFGYIQEFHGMAPASSEYKIESYSGDKNKGIYTQYTDATGKILNNYRGCIIPLPIKVDATSETLGDNLIGIHPQDSYDIAFDEAQEISGRITEMRIFYNWLTNPKVTMNFWGNPNAVSFHAKQDYDLLFKMGIGTMTELEVKEREKSLKKCDRWNLRDTAVLRLSTTDSPKDDECEKENWSLVYGEKKHRLEFLSGKNSIAQLPEGTAEQSVAYYSQVYGFPYIDYAGEWSRGVLTPRIVQNSQDYPLLWRDGAEKLQWFMGVDSAPTGTGDACGIVCGRTGIMIDGRTGIDLMHGQYCFTLKKSGDEADSFTDQVIKEMLRLSRLLRISIDRIGIETHSSGEVLKYALQKSIERGEWGNLGREGMGRFFIVSPVRAVTDRFMFKEIGKMEMAHDICANINTEYWMAVRCAVQTRQLFNVPESILSQFYNRELDLNNAGTRYMLETKRKMLKRGVVSPNDADALCNMIEVMRQRRAFDFRFATTGNYAAYYTPERTARELQKDVLSKLGRVGDLLGVRLGSGGGTGSGRKKEGMFSGTGSM